MQCMIKAIKAGFDVTDEEVDNYITDLKKMSDEAENADDVKKVIAQFDSEDEYWAFMKKKYIRSNCQFKSTLNHWKMIMLRSQVRM